MKIVHVLGLGPSIKDFKPDGNQTVGVNDIYKYFPADIVVCVDRPNRFSNERLKTIIEGEQKTFLSHIGQWEPIVNNFELMKLQPRGPLTTLEQGPIPSSTNSAYVASCIAYRIGGKKIILHGVDFTTHPTLGRSGPMKTTLNHFKELSYQMFRRGVELCVNNPDSALANYIRVNR